MKAFFIFLIELLLTNSLVEAANYEVIVKETGEALVLIRFAGSGLFQVPLQEDVRDVKVKGALYSVENESGKRSLELSIGSTKKAVVLYTTNMATSKKGAVWDFNLELANSNNTLALYLPSSARIISTEPKAFIEEKEMIRQSSLRLLWLLLFLGLLFLS